MSDLERSRKFYSEVLGLEEFKYDKLVPGTGGGICQVSSTLTADCPTATRFDGGAGGVVVPLKSMPLRLGPCVTLRLEGTKVYSRLLTETM